MNVTIQTPGMELTDALRAAIDHAAEETLDALNAPPSTPIVVTLHQPSDAESHYFTAEAAVDVPEGTLHAEGTGPGMAEAIAVLQGSLKRQAQAWQVRHAVRQEHLDTTLLAGKPVSERKISDAERDRENPARKTDHRPPGSR